MLPEQWQDFIKEQGGEFNANHEVEFQTEHNSSTFIADLSYLGVIEVTGEERIDFLQGQLTNDLHQLSTEASQLGGYCTPKGRMLALFRIIALEDKLLLLLPQELLVPILKRLQMYVLMSKVSFRDMSTELARVGLCGEEAARNLENAKYQLPTNNNGVSNSQGITFVKLADEIPRYLCLGETSAIESMWKAAAITAGNTSNWKLKDIQAGLPQVYGNTSEAFIPQMQNLQVLGGISFKKGCYTGQEIVARMQYLGKLKRQMYQLEVNTSTFPALPNAGDELYSPSSSSAQGAGKIVDAQYDKENNKIKLLAVLEISSAESNEIFLDEANSIKAEIVSLPYSIQAE